MRTKLRLSVTILVSLAIGIVGSRVIDAQQTKPAPAYIVSEADEIVDPTAIKEYGAKVSETLAPFSGHYHFIVRGKISGLDGKAPSGAVVIAFESVEQAKAWYNSPAYRAILPIRLKSVKGRMFLAEGIPRQ